MKQPLLLSLFLMLCLGLQGQDFAPVNAEWTLGYKTWGLNFDLETAIRSIEVPNEQMKSGKLCRVMIGDVSPNSPTHGSTNYVYNENGAVYAWYESEGMFQKVFDFDASVGESWDIYVDQLAWDIDSTMLDTMTITIDSVFNEIIDGVTTQSYMYSVAHKMNENTSLWCQDMQLEYNEIGLKANSKLGSGFFIFPVPTELCVTDIYGPPFMGRAQTCYTDDELTYSDLNGEPHCDYQNVGLSEITHLEHNTRVDYNTLQIEVLNVEYPVDMMLYDISGKLVRQRKQSKQMDISGLTSGIYILKMDGDESSIAQKIKL